MWIIKNSWSKNTRNYWCKQMEYEDFGWRSISLFFERVERIITVKVYVISESILCQGEVNNPSTANEAWRKKIEWYGKNNFLEDLNGIDCRKTEFVLRIFPDPRRKGSWRKFKKFQKAYSVTLKNSKDESSLCRRLMTSNGARWRKMYFPLH